MTAQPDLWSVIPPAEAGTYARYRLWRDTPDGAKAYQIVEAVALAEWKSGGTRISVSLLCEMVRTQERIHINNNFRAWMADDLIVDHEQLRPLIETRKRTKGKV